MKRGKLPDAVGVYVWENDEYVYIAHSLMDLSKSLGIPIGSVRAYWLRKHGQTLWVV